MIINISMTGDSNALVKYLLLDQEAKLLYSNVAETKPEAIGSFFSAHASVVPKSRYEMVHMSLRLHPAEILTEHGWIDIAQEALNQLGLHEGHPFIVVLHPANHIHVACGYQNFECQLWDDSLSVTRGIQTAQKLEAKFRLLPTKGLESRPSRPRTLRSDYAHKKRGKTLDKAELFTLLSEARQHACDFSAFQTELKTLGVDIQTVKHGTRDGIKLLYKKRWYSAYKIARQFSFSDTIKFFEHKKSKHLHEIQVPGRVYVPSAPSVDSAVSDITLSGGDATKASNQHLGRAAARTAPQEHPVSLLPASAGIQNQNVNQGNLETRGGSAPCPHNQLPNPDELGIQIGAQVDSGKGSNRTGATSQPPAVPEPPLRSGVGASDPQNSPEPDGKRTEMVRSGTPESQSHFAKKVNTRSIAESNAKRGPEESIDVPCTHALPNHPSPRPPRLFANLPRAYTILRYFDYKSRCVVKLPTDSCVEVGLSSEELRLPTRIQNLTAALLADDVLFSTECPRGDLLKLRFPYLRIRPAIDTILVTCDGKSHLYVWYPEKPSAQLRLFSRLELLNANERRKEMRTPAGKAEQLRSFLLTEVSARDAQIVRGYYILTQRWIARPKVEVTLSSLTNDGIVGDAEFTVDYPDYAFSRRVCLSIPCETATLYQRISEIDTVLQDYAALIEQNNVRTR